MYLKSLQGQLKKDKISWLQESLNLALCGKKKQKHNHFIFEILSNSVKKHFMQSIVDLEYILSGYKLKSFFSFRCYSLDTSAWQKQIGHT